MREWLWLVVLVVGVAVLLGIPGWTLIGRYRERIHTELDAVPQRPVALVFGAGYWPDGTPSDVMQDRVQSAVDLFQAGRAGKVVFSGDNRVQDYNEPKKMWDIAVSLGMRPEDIVMDYAGRRTYDTCYRAKAIFGLREVVLVTQRYHLPRALYLCNGLGLDAVGYAADRQPYVNIRWYWAREVPALWRAWWDLRVWRPTPVLGDPISVLEESDAANP